MLTTPSVRPWKLPAALMMIAFPDGTPSVDRRQVSASVCVRGQSRDPTLHVGPLPGDLECRLDRLDTRVHGQDLVVPEQLGDLLLVRAEHGVVEGAGREAKFGGLAGQSGHDAGVAVALVDGRVGREAVEVLAPFRVPDFAAGRTVEDHRERMVAVHRSQCQVLGPRSFEEVGDTDLCAPNSSSNAIAASLVTRTSAPS